MYASSILQFSSYRAHHPSPPSPYSSSSLQSPVSNSSPDDLIYPSFPDGPSSYPIYAHQHDAPLSTRAYDHPAPLLPQPSQYVETVQAREPRMPLPLSKYIAVSAQWVYSGEHPKVPMIARVSITDAQGYSILDTFVCPTQPVSDYRFAETGLQDVHLHAAPHVADVQQRIRAVIENRIIVGYQLWNFLSLLQLAHPAIDTRDVASFIPFRKSLRVKRSTTVPLPVLVTKLMGRRFGEGYEHPLENARACLDLFRSSQAVWENLMQQGLWPCSTLEDVPEYAYGCFT